MKALTLWQPWASLVVAGAKPYEFRSWRAPRSIIGERIVIHASKRKPDFIECRWLLRALELGGQPAAETCLIAAKAIPILAGCAAELPVGSGLGTAIVGEPRNGAEIGADFGAINAVNDSDRELHCNWGWPMIDIQAWSEPIPMRGAQGLWTWPTPEGAGL